MIVEPLPFLSGRTETSGPGTDHRSPSRGDDAFDRTLSDALNADRADRPTDRRRQRPEADDGRRPAESARRDDGPDTGDDRGARRVDTDDPPTTKATTDKEPADGDSGENRPAAGGDRPSGTDRPRTPDVDAETIDEEAAGQPVPSPVVAFAEPTAALEALTIAGSGRDGTTEQTTATDEVPDAGSVDSGRAVAIEPIIAATASPVAIGDRPAGEPEGTVEGGTDPSAIVSTIDDGGGSGIDPAATDAMVVNEDGTGTVGRINPTASEVEPTESSDEIDEGAVPATGGVTDANAATEAAGDTSATETVGTESNASMAAAAAMSPGRPPSAPDGGPTDAAANASPSPTSDDEHLAPLGQQAATGQSRTETDPASRHPAPELDTTEPAGQTEAPTGAGADETVEQPPGPRIGGPASDLSTAAPSPAPVTSPIRSTAATAETPTPTPELVELQTPGLAERLRPAFAAVRRGVNGLDELRLRIQDDNAGPIKVDIATVDNRVRVVLSAGSDDLMRQLGQERERLADELRRAGFDQASVDVESNQPGRRHRYDNQEPAGRAGSGPADPGLAEASAGSIDRASAGRQPRAGGLDLDL